MFWGEYRGLDKALNRFFQFSLPLNLLHIDNSASTSLWSSMSEAFPFLLEFFIDDMTRRGEIASVGRSLLGRNSRQSSAHLPGLQEKNIAELGDVTKIQQ